MLPPETICSRINGLFKVPDDSNEMYMYNKGINYDYKMHRAKKEILKRKCT